MELDKDLELVNWRGKGREFRLWRLRDLEPLLARVKSDDDIPFWAELWPAAEGLARWLEDRPEMLTGRKVLELGCGLGLVGLVAAAAGARVLQTDFAPLALELAARNASSNGLKLAQQQLDWRERRQLGQFELVIGSDLFYEPDLHLDLLSTLEINLAPVGTAIFSDPGRAGAQAFVSLLRTAGWQVDCTNQDSIQIFLVRRGEHADSHTGQQQLG